jgi:hypothetical protein
MPSDSTSGVKFEIGLRLNCSVKRVSNEVRNPQKIAVGRSAISAAGYSNDGTVMVSPTE